MKQQLLLQEIPASKMTDDVIRRIDLMLSSIAVTENITATENTIAKHSDLAAHTQRRIKVKLRGLFGLSSTDSLAELVYHPQIRQALASLIVRKQRDDAGSMQACRNMIVIMQTGECLSVEDFVLALYSHPGHNAVKAYEGLLDACKSQRVKRISGDVHFDVGIDELPRATTITTFLRNKRTESVALRRARMSREQRTRDTFYITRPKDEYRPGGLLEGDHTEDNILVYRNDGKIAPLWWTILVDVRTGLIKGYEIAYRPNSNTIALAFKRACLGTQLHVAIDVGGQIEYRPANIVDAPDVIRYDNGKDYKSRRTNESVGKVDMNDVARRQAQLICEIQHTGRRHPQAKGTVEVTFRHIQEMFLKYLPGFKGSNYSKKPDSLATEVKQGALLTEEEYRKLAELAVNAYNNKVRESLGGVSPIQFYMMNQAEMKFVDERALNFLQMRWVGRDGNGVKINRGYVRMLGGEYFSMDLDQYNGQRAQLYYDPAEIGRVAVYVKEEFITFAVDTQLLGVSEKDWLVIVKDRARRNKEIADEISSIRNGMTIEEAKAIIYNASLNNVEAVDPVLMQKRIPAVVKLTGIESRAREVHEQLEQQKIAEDVERKRIEKKATPISLLNIDNIK